MQRSSLSSTLSLEAVLSRNGTGFTPDNQPPLDQVVLGLPLPPPLPHKNPTPELPNVTIVAPTPWILRMCQRVPTGDEIMIMERPV